MGEGLGKRWGTRGLEMGVGLMVVVSEHWKVVVD